MGAVVFPGFVVGWVLWFSLFLFYFYFISFAGCGVVFWLLWLSGKALLYFFRRKTRAQSRSFRSSRVAVTLVVAGAVGLLNIFLCRGRVVSWLRYYSWLRRCEIPGYLGFLVCRKALLYSNPYLFVCKMRPNGVVFLLRRVLRERLPPLFLWLARLNFVYFCPKI